MDISRQSEIKTLLINMFARRFFMLRVFLAMAIIALLVVVCMSKVYTVTGQVIVLSAEIYQQERNVLGDGSGARYLPVTLKDIETEATMLRSLSLLRRTVHKLYDDGKLVFEKSLVDAVIKEPLRTRVVAPLKRLFGAEETAGDPAEGAVAAVMDRLAILPLPGSNIIVVNYETDNVEQGQLIVDALMDEYLQMRNDLLLSNSENLFSKKKQMYKERLSALTDEKLKLFSEYDSRNPQEELSLLLQNIDKENSESNNISDQLLRIAKWQHFLEENIKLVAGTRATEISVALGLDNSRVNGGEMASYSEIMQQIEQIRSLQNEFDTASVAFTKNSLPVEQVLDKLELAKQRLIALFKNRNQEQIQEMLVLQSLAEQKNKRLTDLRKRVAYLSEMQVQTTEIDAELSAINEAYTQYSKIYEEKHLENLFSQDKWRNVKIMEYAPLPLKPSSPSPTLVLAVGLVAAFITAVSAGLLVDIVKEITGSDPFPPAAQGARGRRKKSRDMRFSLLPGRFMKWLTQSHR